MLLDPRFLIPSVDPTRANHAAAVQYYRECVQRQVPMYLSTIVISEFQVKQALNHLPWRSFVMLPFNVDQTILCGVVIEKYGARLPG